jgi:hypothetical protein
MIIIGEPNNDIRKRLCDLLSKERIIGVTTISDVLETLCKFRNHVDLIIINIALLNEILSNHILQRLCQRLGTREPPTVGYFTNGQKALKEDLKRDHANLILIEYSEHRESFPEHYLSTLKQIYPGINVDVERAKASWAEQEQDQEFVDIQEWLGEEGFLEGIEKEEPRAEIKSTATPLSSAGDLPAQEPTKPEAQPAKEEVDYKKLYLELKKKHDELLSYVNELMDSVKKPDSIKIEKS